MGNIEEKEITIEQKCRNAENNLNHLQKLFNSTNEKCNNLHKTVSDTLEYRYVYDKNDLSKELLEVTSKIVRSNYDSEENKVKDLIRQAYLTGRLETLTQATENQARIVESIKDLKLFTNYSV